MSGATGGADAESVDEMWFPEPPRPAADVLLAWLARDPDHKEARRELYGRTVFRFLLDGITYVVATNGRAAVALIAQETDELDAMASPPAAVVHALTGPAEPAGRFTVSVFFWWLDNASGCLTRRDCGCTHCAIATATLYGQPIRPIALKAPYRFAIGDWDEDYAVTFARVVDHPHEAFRLTAEDRRWIIAASPLDEDRSGIFSPAWPRDAEMLAPAAILPLDGVEHNGFHVSPAALVEV